MWTNEFVNHVVFAMVIIAGYNVTFELTVRLLSVHHVFFIIVIIADDPNDGIL